MGRERGRGTCEDAHWERVEVQRAASEDSSRCTTDGDQQLSSLTLERERERKAQTEGEAERGDNCEREGRRERETLNWRRSTYSESSARVLVAVQISQHTAATVRVSWLLCSTQDIRSPRRHTVPS